MRSQQSGSKIPQVNLVPMIDVLMSVLMFFVILSMNLTGMVPNINLPSLQEGVREGNDGEGGQSARKDKPPEALIVGLDKEGQIILDGEPAEMVKLTETMEVFLTENAEGVVKLTADREIDYRQVDGLLKTMAEIGGDRVLLVVK